MTKKLTEKQTNLLRFLDAAGGSVPAFWMGSRATFNWRTVDSLIRAGILQMRCDSTGRYVERVIITTETEG